MVEPNALNDSDQFGEGVGARIVSAAAYLIAESGPDAATTRAVAAAADVQAPTIYRLFGDKRGLLDAVAEHGLRAYVLEKGLRDPDPDPVQALRDGWDMHVDFGLSHPGLFAIMSGTPPLDRRSPALAAGMEILRRRMRKIALAGRLRVSEDRAISLLHSVGTGTVLTLIAQPEEQRDTGLSAFAREAVVAAITHEATVPLEPGANQAATTLKANLDQTSVLTHGERVLMGELLDRIADGTRLP